MRWDATPDEVDGPDVQRWMVWLPGRYELAKLERAWSYHPGQTVRPPVLRGGRDIRIEATLGRSSS